MFVLTCKPYEIDQSLDEEAQMLLNTAQLFLQYLARPNILNEFPALSHLKLKNPVLCNGSDFTHGMSA